MDFLSRVSDRRCAESRKITESPSTLGDCGYPSRPGVAELSRNPLDTLIRVCADLRARSGSWLFESRQLAVEFFLKGQHRSDASICRSDRSRDPEFAHVCRSPNPGAADGPIIRSRCQPRPEPNHGRITYQLINLGG